MRGGGQWGLGMGGDRNSGNPPYLVANTYGLNFIKIGGISIFRGAEVLYKGVYNNRKKLKFWESVLFSG